MISFMGGWRRGLGVCGCRFTTEDTENTEVAQRKAKAMSPFVAVSNAATRNLQLFSSVPPLCSLCPLWLTHRLLTPHCPHHSETSRRPLHLARRGQCGLGGIDLLVG